MQYEALGEARYRVEREGVREWIRVPARRNWFVLLFLGVWLTGWTVGGVFVIGTLLRSFDLFLAAWLAMWAVGWLFAATTVAWQLGGAELIEVAGGDLTHTVRMPAYRRTRRYRGSQMRDVKAVPAVAVPWGMNLYQGAYPPMFRRAGGSVTFRYGVRSEGLAPGLDEAEAEGIAAWVRGRLGRGAA